MKTKEVFMDQPTPNQPTQDDKELVEQNQKTSQMTGLPPADNPPADDLPTPPQSPAPVGPSPSPPPPPPEPARPLSEVMAEPPKPTPSAAPPPPAPPVPPPSPKENVGVGTPNIGVENTPTKPTSPAPAPPEPPSPPEPIAPPQKEPETDKNKEYKIDVAAYSDDAEDRRREAPPAPNAAPVQVKNYQNPDPQVMAGTPQPPVKAGNPNVSLVVFIVLALIVGSAGGFFGFRYWDKLKTSASVEKTPEATQSPALEGENLSYTSNLYDFSLQYPVGWFASTTDPQAETIAFASNQDTLSGDPTGYKIEVNFQNSNGQTLKKWVEANAAAMGENKKAKEITVSGETAYQQELEKNGPKVATYIERQDKIMLITYSAAEGLFGEGGDLYNALINSIELK